MAEKIWEVVGGGDKGGIICRAGKDLKSKEKGRLGTGARVKELQLVDGRLQYLRLKGDGPDTGWVSVTTKENKELMVRVSQGTPREPLSPASPARAAKTKVSEGTPPESPSPASPARASKPKESEGPPLETLSSASPEQTEKAKAPEVAAPPTKPESSSSNAPSPAPAPSTTVPSNTAAAEAEVVAPPTTTSTPSPESPKICLIVTQSKTAASPTTSPSSSVSKPQKEVVDPVKQQKLDEAAATVKKAQETEVSKKGLHAMKANVEEEKRRKEVEDARKKELEKTLAEARAQQEKAEDGSKGAGDSDVVTSPAEAFEEFLAHSRKFEAEVQATLAKKNVDVAAEKVNAIDARIMAEKLAEEAQQAKIAKKKKDEEEIERLLAEEQARRDALERADAQRAPDGVTSLAEAFEDFTALSKKVEEELAKSEAEKKKQLEDEQAMIKASKESDEATRNMDEATRMAQKKEREESVARMLEEALAAREKEASEQVDSSKFSVHSPTEAFDAYMAAMSGGS